jgi:hypothetical protein
MNTWPQVQAPILFVRCESHSGVKARVAISSTWYGIASATAIHDATELLVNHHAGTGELNRDRIRLLDDELAALSFEIDGAEIRRDRAPNIHAALEEGVPTATRFIRADFASATRFITLEAPARARLQQWALAGGDAPPGAPVS